MQPHQATELRPVPSSLASGVRPRDAHRALSFVERVTLFVCAAHRDRAMELLDGFAGSPRKEARAFARTVADWSSAARQARLTIDFGTRADAPARVHALLREASPAMRAALVEALPEPLRPRGDPGTAVPEGSPMLAALAHRLVREAIR
jgi:hypothetical protein